MPALKADFAPEVQLSEGAAPTSAPPRLRIRIDDDITIPGDVVDLESFCLWTCSDDFPEHGRFSYLAGLLWVDLTMEEIYRHGSPKGEITTVLTRLAREQDKGRFLPDGTWYKSEEADLSTVPDGMFVSYDAVRSGRVQRVKSPKGVLFQLSGSPEMTLEIVSSPSERKDTKKLYELYWKAGVLEYWLVDVREGRLRFDIFKHGPKGYTATRRQAGGWLKSAVFGKSFRLTESVDRLGDPLYTLEVRD